ncbi:hypothetical protein FHX39_000622 [Friedmanniella antarctica]|uniref:Uncharacterized protein n=1 Tax=Microlunatus antarcticus TaxID=53388 RepID=A0A7W5JSY1_9ACTN|nr:hypothetical protein [Microlunatus antarcticus]
MGAVTGAGDTRPAVGTGDGRDDGLEASTARASSTGSASGSHRGTEAPAVGGAMTCQACTAYARVRTAATEARTRPAARHALPEPLRPRVGDEPADHTTVLPRTSGAGSTGGVGLLIPPASSGAPPLSAGPRC